ncbi:MAG: 16S rRNA (cytidine(1402)-2'-O)-methyltransferase [Gemmatimonadales bacterium]
MAATLYVIATPLGNLGDLSPRAGETLRRVALVAAEDTRRTRQLLSAIDAHPRLVSCHAHTPERRIDALVAALVAGDDLALVTDAGTPAISDPGTGLVAAARRAGIRVEPIPGPSAIAAAVSASGLPGDRFLFLGFLPRRGSARRRLIERAAAEPWTVVFFESPNRLALLLADLAGACGADLPVVVARELSKVHEDVRDGTLAGLHAYYLQHPALGEVTVVMAGRPAAATAELDVTEIDAMIARELGAGESRKDVVRMVADRFGIGRNDAYRMVMERP